MTKQRLHIPAIDTLRGVAATLVCFYHFVYTTTDYVNYDLVREFFHLGYYGVHMFFVISGIVIPLSMVMSDYKHGSWFRFMSRRFIRIEPPYLAAVVIGTFYLIIRNYIPGTADVDMTPNGTTLLLHVGYLIPFFEGHHWINNVFWSLAVEFQYYLLLCLVFPYFLKGQLWQRILLYVLFMSVGAIMPLRSMLPIWLPLFMVGISYVLLRYKYIEKLEYGLVLLCSLALTTYYIDYKATLFGAGTLAIIHFLPQLRNKASKFLGDISYSLYLLHTVVGSAFINYLSHTYRLGWQQVLVIGCGYIISVIAAYALYRAIELPSKRWASKVKY